MSFPQNISKQNLFDAITKIDSEGIPPGADSQYYDVIYNGKRYPPKLIVSYANLFANGEVLARNEFEGGENTPCFNLLLKEGFIIKPKEQKENQTLRIWIEKTIIHNRKDRLSGDRALGKALWSPRKSSDGKDIYKNMRIVNPGDIILHLVDNEKIIGISIAKYKYTETDGLAGTEWNVPSYLIELQDYIELNSPLKRESFLIKENQKLLEEIRNKSEVFYTENLNLRQGAYLTPCPIELFKLINDTYKDLSSYELPYSNLLVFAGSENEINSSIATEPIDNNTYKDLTSNELPFSDRGFLKEVEKELHSAFEISQIVTDFAKAGLQFDEKLIARFTASLLTKQFVILTGLSGSGKTKLAQAFAMWICENNNQYCIVPVGADWSNRDSLLGFPNALTEKEYVKPDNGFLDLLIESNHNPNKPYFLILDEMNLSHVERYFADLLSVMESQSKISLHPGVEDWNGIPSNISLPRNLFIIGTVNIDETTYMFSPKVLDRANVIEFIVSSNEMYKYLKSHLPLNLIELETHGASMGNNFVEIAKDNSLVLEDVNTVIDILMCFFQELKKIGAEFGYRSASEILRLSALLKKISPSFETAEVIDIAITQKLLPKIHGSRRKLEPVLRSLASLCIIEKEKLDDYLIKNIETLPSGILYPMSFRKICRMYENLLSNGFTSFTEA